MPPLPSPFAVFRTFSRRSYPISRTLPSYTRSLARHQHTIPPIHSPIISQEIPNNSTAKGSASSTQEPQIPTINPGSHRPRAKPQSQTKSESTRPDHPTYELTFTCTPCSTRSTHSISKQGYHFGSVLVTCPECRNRHVIADHLNIFGDRNLTIEDLMREQGQLIKKGTLSEDGDLEFWSDGSMTKRERQVEEKKEGANEEGKEGSWVRGESFKKK